MPPPPQKIRGGRWVPTRNTRMRFRKRPLFLAPREHPGKSLISIFTVPFGVHAGGELFGGWQGWGPGG